MANKIIEQLTSISGLKIECPKCNETFSIKIARPFSMYGSYPLAARKILIGRIESMAELNEDIAARTRRLAENQLKRPEKITVSTQATNFGQISEQILPAFVTFPYEQAECRILYKPIDYVVFVGLSKRDRVEAIKFAELKTGAGILGKRQRQIRDCITEGKIKHKVID